jgi:aspartate dehydrogenase
MASTNIITVGIVGYGKLGQYLAKEILSQGADKCGLQIGFIWNRTPETVETDPIAAPYLLRNLQHFAEPRALVNGGDMVTVDLVIEVAHPDITTQYGEQFARACNVFLGSPTALADRSLEQRLRQAASDTGHAIYVPSGALWGAVDLQKMADADTLGSVTITMKKEPSSLKVMGSVANLNKQYIESDSSDEHVLYDGCVRDLCPLAPNNVNTMACAALAAHTLGFDQVRARLVADKRLTAHVIEIDIRGKGRCWGGTSFIHVAILMML